MDCAPGLSQSLESISPCVKGFAAPLAHAEHLDSSIGVEVLGVRGGKGRLSI